jgi:hypothetical protein
MLTMTEQERLIRILELLKEEQSIHKGLDVSVRQRDVQGRFLPNESASRNREESPLRSIRLVRVKGSYGTYLVKDWESYIRAIGALCVTGVIVLLAIFFKDKKGPFSMPK